MIAIRYHDSTKHHFSRFAPSLGYLDWATQPDPFRRYIGAPIRALPRAPLAAGVAYAALYQPPSRRASSVSAPGSSAAPFVIDDDSIGEFLRCSMGLSAWKRYGESRWALRVNPSSGNLHPTEAWIVRGGQVCHYAPREHALEERCVLETTSFSSNDRFLVALTSITWREAWKYGQRAFRYCQHDTGHAIGALRFAAGMLGWRMQLLPSWSDTQIATLLGLDRDADFEDGEREEAECIALVGDWDAGIGASADPVPLIDAARRGQWRGHANRLSAAHVAWPAITEVTEATRYPGSSQLPTANSQLPRSLNFELPTLNFEVPEGGTLARRIILQRRSALAFDPRGVLQRDAFFSMLARLQPSAPPWDVIDWPPQVQLALFVHRVQDVTPGLYAYLRDPAVISEWKSAMRAEFLWEEVHDHLFLLVPVDAGRTANRLSCDQAIAEEGFFSLGMVARFEQPLHERGESFYRRLFWECGLLGQILYLEAESVGARATGIGCYYDEPVHDLLGLSGHAWQSLYHFSMGLPVEDSRLTTEPGYGWE